MRFPCQRSLYRFKRTKQLKTAVDQGFEVRPTAHARALDSAATPHASPRQLAADDVIKRRRRYS